MKPIPIGTISLDGDKADTFDVDRAVEILNQHLQNPNSPVFKAFVNLISGGQYLGERGRTNNNNSL